MADVRKPSTTKKKKGKRDHVFAGMYKSIFGDDKTSLERSLESGRQIKKLAKKRKTTTSRQALERKNVKPITPTIPDAPIAKNTGPKATQRQHLVEKNPVPKAKTTVKKKKRDVSAFTDMSKTKPTRGQGPSAQPFAQREGDFPNIKDPKQMSTRGAKPKGTPVKKRDKEATTQKKYPETPFVSNYGRSNEYVGSGTKTKGGRRAVARSRVAEQHKKQGTTPKLSPAAQKMYTKSESAIGAEAMQVKPETKPSTFDKAVDWVLGRDKETKAIRRNISRTGSKGRIDQEGETYSNWVYSHPYTKTPYRRKMWDKQDHNEWEERQTKINKVSHPNQKEISTNSKPIVESSSEKKPVKKVPNEVKQTIPAKIAKEVVKDDATVTGTSYAERVKAGKPLMSVHGDHHPRPRLNPSKTTKPKIKGFGDEWSGEVPDLSDNSLSDKIGKSLSEMFGSYSAHSGVEGTSSWHERKYKKGKRTL